MPAHSSELPICFSHKLLSVTTILVQMYKEEFSSQRTKGSELIWLVKNSENIFLSFHCYLLPFVYKEEVYMNHNHKGPKAQN